MLSDDRARRALAALRRFPCRTLGRYPTPIDPLDRFGRRAGIPQRLFVKRDDAISFGFGGNKVRKLQYVLPSIVASGADTVITCGGVQSNHVRATAAAATAAGLDCHVVVNGTAPTPPTGNALLDRLYGATFEYVSAREERAPAMERAAARLRAEGRRPAIVPLGASTPHGALGYVAAIGEMLDQGLRPDLIVHACSSGGTSAGLLAGCAVHGLDAAVIGISADDPPAAVETAVRSILRGLGELLEIGPALESSIRVQVDDAFVGPGYGEPTPASREAAELMARAEAIVVDHSYTAKATAGLLDYCRSRRIGADATVLFWHTGGQVALFA
ncbi:MAG: D-cysteine desulfhydrase family protein [Gemmatimonadetes bacterium]|nr:D-cysteine desulfhydrase family protein [Gemmatimonadota bacterium]